MSSCLFMYLFFCCCFTYKYYRLTIINNSFCLVGPLRPNCDIEILLKKKNNYQEAHVGEQILSHFLAEVLKLRKVVMHCHAF